MAKLPTVGTSGSTLPVQSSTPPFLQTREQRAAAMEARRSQEAAIQEVPQVPAPVAAKNIVVPAEITGESMDQHQDDDTKDISKRKRGYEITDSQVLYAANPNLFKLVPNYRNITQAIKLGFKLPGVRILSQITDQENFGSDEESEEQ